MVEVELVGTDVETAKELAQRTLDRWKNSRGHYNNKPRSHVVGKVGELAVEKLLEESPWEYDALFRDPEKQGEADFLINRDEAGPFRLDAKAWSAEYWPDLGRCVAVGQVENLEEKADLIVWTVLQGEVKGGKTIDGVVESDSTVVHVEGWSTIQDVRSAPVRETGRAYMRKVTNHQLDQENLRPIEELLSAEVDLGDMAT